MLHLRRAASQERLSAERALTTRESRDGRKQRYPGQLPPMGRPRNRDGEPDDRRAGSWRDRDDRDRRRGGGGDYHDRDEDDRPRARDPSQGGGSKVISVQEAVYTVAIAEEEDAAEDMKEREEEEEEQLQQPKSWLTSWMFSRAS
ncbi:hypothetical protein NUW54_g5744 [Trametes sanguinea]|uniref:Uncharacterized protein n=1 Tax=Trametes sanguinea TaxID=158606 RepID=A0ACC1PU81_9APHY|nr:hypothetical protein NUW54_g5744 [Trametes sanguinea]